MAAEAERLIAGGVAAGARSACWCARSRPRAPRSRPRSRSAPCRSGPAARPPTSSAPRCATCSPGCARWPIRTTPARWCARSAGRRSSCARWTSRASPSWPGGASSTCPRAVAAALEGPQLSEEGRDRARAFLRLYRSASNAFDERRPDAFVMRLIERIGLRRQQVFATQADTVERLRNIAKLPELATAYMRREPQATAREFARYLAAVAESGLREEEAVGQPSTPGRLDHDHARGQGPRVRPRLRARPVRRRHARPVPPARPATCRTSCSRSASTGGGGASAHEAEMRRLLHVAMTRARKGLVLAWAEGEQHRRQRRARPPSTRRRARRSTSRRRSSRRSCSAPPRDCTPRSG